MRILYHIGVAIAVSVSFGATIARGEMSPASAGTPAVATLDRAPGALEVPYGPAEGAVCRRNPPAFIWLPVPGAAAYELQVSASLDFAAEATENVTGLRLSVHNPARRLAPGAWHWRYRAVPAQGSPSAWSRARAFTISPDAAILEVPPLADLEARIPEGHPRVFVTPPSLDAFRARRLGQARGAWAGLDSRARAAVGQPLPPEPAAGQRGGSAAADRLELLAFVSLAGGDRALAAEARRLLLHLCAWNPAGATGRDPDAASVLLLKSARAYDWVHDSLGQGDRERVQGALRIRGEEAFRRLREACPEARPYDRRSLLLLEALGEASLALYRDLPEARAWLGYALPVYLAVFPPWGGEEGGWSQGMRDWAWSTASALLHAEALRTAVGLDILAKPWYRNTGLFKLYSHPPLAAGSSASCPDAPAGAADCMDMERLGSACRDGRLQWYARRTGAEYGGIPAYLWKGEQPPAQPPADLPPSRLFADAGIAALHTRLWDPGGDIAFLFRSSPQGSWGQAHADQNTFLLDAFGEPLAVASGWAAWDANPRLREWMHQTRAHNGLLANGRGQPIQRADAVGRITAFHSGGDYDYVVGDASRAYPGLLTRFQRRVLFVRPRFFVLLDQVEAPVASRFEWTLHALERMAVDPAARSAVLRRGSACLLARWLAPERLALAQTDRLPLANEEESGAAPRQWHLSVATTDEAQAAQFLTLLAPYRAGEEARLPASERVDAENAVGVHAGNALVGFRTCPDARRVTLAGIETDGEAFAVHLGASGQVSRLFVAAGSTLASGGTLLLSMPPGSTASVSIEGESVIACLDFVAGGEVRLRLPVAPRQVLLAGKPVPPENAAYDAEAHLLSVRAPTGSSRLSVNAPLEDPLPAPPVVEVVLASGTAAGGARNTGRQTRTAASRRRVAAPLEEKVSLRLGIVRSPAGTVVAYGDLPAPPGPYRLEGAERAMVRIGGRPAVESAIVWLAGPTDVAVESAPAGMPRLLRLVPVPLAPELPAQPVPSQALEWPEVHRVEAESVASQAGGEAAVEKDREELSGKAGLAGWDLPGHQLTWRFQAPRSGEYLLILKGTVQGAAARRLVCYDGRRTPDAWRPVLFAGSSGAGESAPRDALFRVTEPVLLTAGEHTLTLTALSGAMDLDLLAFQSVE